MVQPGRWEEKQPKSSNRRVSREECGTEANGINGSDNGVGDDLKATGPVIKLATAGAQAGGQTAGEVSGTRAESPAEAASFLPLYLHRLQTCLRPKGRSNNG